MSEDQLRSNLTALGVSIGGSDDFSKLFNKLKGKSTELDQCARYTNGHLFDLYETERTPLVEEIALKLGGMTKGDFEAFDKFGARLR
jgi:hypothetical protein